MSLFEKICNCPSVPSENKGMTALIRKELAPYGCEETSDGIGNVFFSKKTGEGKHVMLCAPLDVGGVVATYIEGSKIYVGSLGKSSVMQTAFTKVVFEKAQGVLVAPDNYCGSTAVTDCYVETYDKNVSDKVKQGDKGYFDGAVSFLENGVCWGHGAGEKCALYTAIDGICRLLDLQGQAVLEKYGVGCVTVALLAQSSLMSRGALTACHGKNPDEVILISAMNCGEKYSPDDKYIVKLCDKGVCCDSSLTQNICVYFDETGISYKKTVESDGDTALASLSHAFSCPACANICIPVFHNRVVIR